ncbi:carbohydrate-binding protein [Chitinophaga rhizophila]|nr:carbohydrate-binding protein [Chitinophaga rhizophila]
MIVRGQTAGPAPSTGPAPTGATAPAAPQRKGNFETEFKMKSGTYLGFGQVNLGMGEIGFKVVVFCQNKEKKNGRLEFRIDHPKGKKSRRIGTLKIPFTGDTTYALKLVGNPKYSYGIHDLYLVAKGNPFSITSITFVQDY